MLLSHTPMNKEVAKGVLDLRDILVCTGSVQD